MKRYIAPFISAIAVALIIVAFGLFYFLIFREIPGTGYIRFIFLAITIVAVGGFTLNEMKEVALDLSIPFQKMQHVKESKIASAVLPGLGQYMNNDPLGGTLFLISDITVIAGTLIGAYFVLPDELRFDRLNYFSDSRSTIRDRWDNQSFNDLLPTMGVMVGGFVVSGVIRLLSAEHAGKLAQKNIAEGKIQFEPKLILPAFDSSVEHGYNQDGFGLGMRIGF